jgi:hypothetical protein
MLSSLAKPVSCLQFSSTVEEKNSILAAFIVLPAQNQTVAVYSQFHTGHSPVPESVLCVLTLTSAARYIFIGAYV